MTRNRSQEAWRVGNHLQISLVWFGVNEGIGMNPGDNEDAVDHAVV